MEKCIILRYGEISVRGRNRIFYEDVLERNVREMLKRNNVPAKIRRYKGRMIVLTDANADFLKRAFGVTSFSLGYRVKRSGEEINNAVKMFGNPLPLIKFADRGKEDKELVEKVNLGSDGKAFVEIYPDNAFVSQKKEKAAGGLPVGSEGKVIVVIEDQRSILSAILMMKRGCEVIPYLKKEVNLDLLRAYGCYNEPVKEMPSDADAIVSEFKEPSELPRLNPLVGINKEKTEEMLKFCSEL